MKVEHRLPSIEVTQKLIISGRLTGRNEAERAARAHWSKGAKLKSDETIRVQQEILVQRIKPVLYGKAEVTVTFFEPDGRRDADNVLGGLKYIMDGLVKMRIIIDDGPKYVDLITLPVKIDRKNPRIEVQIKGQIEDCSQMQNFHREIRK